MDARDEVGAQGGVDGAVALDAAHGRKGGGAQDDVEMSLSGAIIACVACVAVAVIDHLQPIRGESIGQFVVNLVCDWHISVNPLQSVA